MFINDYKLRSMILDFVFHLAHVVIYDNTYPQKGDPRESSIAHKLDHVVNLAVIIFVMSQPSLSSSSSSSFQSF
ncbi:hypothetical protein RIF29_21792 [Crotalaria pallida]|uniref:Uncharacterized protein n=1 Tax=Crotalaria pallida TaxID=3830 RepID=A0AAN9F578_CROPI